ncbi:RNA polymerase sigma-70 factor [Coprobacter sp.]
MQADELLIEISENNNQKAFKLLFESYYPSLCIFGRRYIESEDAVEDVVQDVFTSLWENRSKINIETSAKNYLITMTRNFCLNYLQRNRTEQNYIQGKINLFDTGTNDSEEVVLFSELKSLMIETLKSLPIEYQRVFIMSRFENKNYREIAEALGISVKSVERYKMRTEKKLRENLQDYISIMIIVMIIQIITEINSR